MSEIINSGRAYIAAKAYASEPVDITHFVLANIAGLDHTDPVDLDEVMPDVGDIVATLPVTQTGYITTAKVVYSLFMDSSVGPFDFNWVGLKAATGELIAVEYCGTVKKLKTAGGVRGNNISRNFMLHFANAQSLTEIVIPAETWQINFPEMFVNVLASNLTVTVGSGGDFAQIPAAMQYLSKFKTQYAATPIRKTINLLSGFVMTEQVIVDGLDFSDTTIIAVDATTTIDRSTIVWPATNANRAAFMAVNGGKCPIIKCQFNMNTASHAGNDSIHGLMAIGAGSCINLIGNAGVTSALWSGAFADFGGQIIGNTESSGSVSQNFSGAGYSGIYAGNNSSIALMNANISGCGSYGAISYGGQIYAYGANAGSAGTYGFSVNSGAIIRAHASTGTLSQSANNNTASGIIYK